MYVIFPKRAGSHSSTALSEHLIELNLLLSNVLSVCSTRARAECFDNIQKVDPGGNLRVRHERKDYEEIRG